MRQLSRSRRLSAPRMLLALAGAALLTLAAACQSEKPPSTLGTPTPATAAAAAPSVAPTRPASDRPLGALKVTPDTGPVHTPFIVTGEGLPPNKSVAFLWDTVTGSYATEVVKNRLTYRDRKFAPTRLHLTTATTDAQGRVSARLEVPEDYGEVHDLYAQVDGADVARGGFFVTRSFKMTPDSGPIGTLITVEIKGLGSTTLTSSMAMRYDNRYTGWISATRSRGTARAQFRAAGPVGKRLVEVVPASHLTPYINVEQTSVAHLAPFRTPFTVTDDKGPPASTTQWPDDSRVRRDSRDPRPGIGLTKVALPGAPSSVLPAAGPVGAKAVLNVSGLPRDADVRIAWVNSYSDGVFGANYVDVPLSNARVGADGALKTTIEIPNAVGGWHAIWVIQGETVLTETPFFLERSLPSAPPIRVKEGEMFAVDISGVGWNDVDNGLAVTYDNGYIGYACGTSAQGNVTLNLAATGGPGTHLIDLYPMIYDNGASGWPWQYNLPQLTGLDDHPSLDLGFRIPVFRLAIEIVP